MITAEAVYRKYPCVDCPMRKDAAKKLGQEEITKILADDSFPCVNHATTNAHCAGHMIVK